MKLSSFAKGLLVGSTMMVSAAVETPEYSDGFTVMTRNLYLGGATDPSIGALLAGDMEGFGVALGAAARQALTSGLAPRMKAVAQEIADNNVLLVGLQESFVWTANGDTLVDALHMLKLFLKQDHNLEYEVLSTNQVANVTVPSAGEDSTEYRLFYSDAILAWKTHGVNITNPQSGTYQALLSFPTPLGDLSVDHGWVSADVTVEGCHQFRFVTTHLEDVAPPLVEFHFRAAQATQLLTDPALPIQSRSSSSEPNDKNIILVGDFNSQPATKGDSADIIFNQGGFTDAWAAAGHGDGFTYGHDSNLDDVNVSMEKRLDYITVKGNLNVKKAKTIDTVISTTERPFWPSDHAGVIATIACQVPPVAESRKEL